MPRFMVRRGCSPEQHYWIGSPEQLPACGGLPVDRTCLLEGGLYVSSCAHRCGQNWAPRAAFFGLLVGTANTSTWDFLRGCKLQSSLSISTPQRN